MWDAGTAVGLLRHQEATSGEGSQVHTCTAVVPAMALCVTHKLHSAKPVLRDVWGANLSEQRCGALLKEHCDTMTGYLV